MLGDYMAAMEHRARMQAERKAEQEAEAKAAKDAALQQSAEYLGRLEVTRIWRGWR